MILQDVKTESSMREFIQKLIYIYIAMIKSFLFSLPFGVCSVGLFVSKGFIYLSILFHFCIESSLQEIL